MGLLRVMMCDDGTGRPSIGVKSYQLGVRPFKPNKHSDVSVSFPHDVVLPERAEGLSCSMMPFDQFLALAFTQQSLRFDSKRAVWEIEVDALPAGLMAVPRPVEHDPDHHQIEPTYEMTLQEFQTLLASSVHS